MSNIWNQNMGKSVITILLFFVSSLSCFSQTKSFEDAQNEIKNFNGASAFSLIYDETRYLTVAEIRFEVLTEKDALRKQFSTFEILLTSSFSAKGIDAKPYSVSLCFITQSKTIQFSRDNGLTVSFSNGDVDFGEPNRTTEMKRGKVNEKLCWNVSKEISEDFSKSASIDFEIGKFNGKIPEDKLNIFKHYGQLLAVEKSEK
jgi:hypothetical protein